MGMTHEPQSKPKKVSKGSSQPIGAAAGIILYILGLDHFSTRF